MSPLRPLAQAAVPENHIFEDTLTIDKVRQTPVKYRGSTKVGHVAVKGFVLLNIFDCRLKNFEDVLRNNTPKNNGS